MNEPETSPAKQRIRPVRAVVATLVSVLLIAGALAYHDGVVGVDRLMDATSEGGYRFKGRIESVDADGQGFTLRDGSGTRALHWNVTRPATGDVVVVDAELDNDGQLAAVALSKALVFRET